MEELFFLLLLQPCEYHCVSSAALQDESLLQDYLMQVAFKGTWQETGLNPEEHLSEKLKELESEFLFCAQ